MSICFKSATSPTKYFEQGHTHQAMVVKAGLMKADANVADALEFILGAEVMRYR